MAVGVPALPAERTASAADAARLGDSVIRLIRSFSRARAQYAAANPAVDLAAIGLLAHLATNGPMRAGSLADLALSDPSTISRQIAGLVRDGLVERRADPVDGRASLLAATQAGEAAYLEHLSRRNRHYQRVLADWSEGDSRRFAELVTRFVEDFERCRPHFLSDMPAQHAPDEPTGSGVPAARREEH